MKVLWVHSPRAVHMSQNTCERTEGTPGRNLSTSLTDPRTHFAGSTHPLYHIALP